tara:strand:- start:5291 stop:6121 length:831 start_codon:yes stop_codon:yes gene_type:complete
MKKIETESYKKAESLETPTKEYPQVWFGSRGAYNAGELVGEWVLAEDAKEELPRLLEEWRDEDPEYGEEWFIADYDGFHGLSSTLGENPDLNDVVTLAKSITEHGEPMAAFADRQLDSYGNIDDLEEDFEDSYIGEFRTEKLGSYEISTELIHDIIDQVGGPIDYLGKEKVSNMLDYDQWNYDLKMSGEGYGYEETEDGDFKIIDMQDENVRNIGEFSTKHEAENAAKEMNDDMLDEFASSDSTTAEKYFDYEQFAYDMSIGGDIWNEGDFWFWNR